LSAFYLSSSNGRCLYCSCLNLALDIQETDGSIKSAMTNYSPVEKVVMEQRDGPYCLYKVCDNTVDIKHVMTLVTQNMTENRDVYLRQIQKQML